MAYFDTGGKIRELRRERGLNQDQLAELAALNRVTVAKYESGRVEPGAQALARIADALEVSTDVLLGRAEEPPVQVVRPQTVEAQIISGGIDRLPEEQRKQAIDLMKIVFAQHADYFEKGTDENDP